MSSRFSGFLAARSSASVLALFCALSCGGENTGGASASARTSGDSGSGGSANEAGGAAGHQTSGAGGALFGAGGAPSSGGSSDAGPPNVDAGPPPLVTCGVDAGADASPDAAVCAPPPSRCADTETLVYYSGGACVDGLCQFVTEILHCPTGCVDGGCHRNFTLTR
ncbi:MAG TPA: hypothetical protein VHE30_14140 [Polyangiaceae bacterium]|nr:hypothetical protein [Polyangiaceae bacterium]